MAPVFAVTPGTDGGGQNLQSQRRRTRATIRSVAFFMSAGDSKNGGSSELFIFRTRMSDPGRTDGSSDSPQCDGVGPDDRRPDRARTPPPRDVLCRRIGGDGRALLPGAGVQRSCDVSANIALTRPTPSVDLLPLER